MAETVSTILVPVDFSPHAERAYYFATALAQKLGATVSLLHVVDDSFATAAWSGEVYVPGVPEWLDELTAAAERQLATLSGQAPVGGIVTKTEVVSGRPASAIAEYADAGGFDLIVMGTHGRTGLAHAVMGSVAERVLRKASCPVLTVRERRARTRRLPRKVGGISQAPPEDCPKAIRCSHVAAVSSTIA